MAKKYSSVAEMVREVSEDTEFASDTARRLSQREIVKHLVALRCARGQSQGEIAGHMKCSQSRISKLEHGADEDLSIGDLAGYLDALGLESRVLITKRGWRAVDEVKYHAFSIKRVLDELADHAAGDDAHAIGVFKFFREAAWNLSRFFRESVEKLQLPAVETTSARICIEVDEAIEDAEDGQECAYCSSDFLSGRGSRV